jgi:hypothetical protein
MSNESLRSTLALLTVSSLLIALSGCGEPFEEEQKVLEKVEAANGDFMPRYEPDEASFYRMPWPSDARVSDSGTIDLSDIQNAGDSFVRKYVRTLSTIHGFSTMPVAYIPFSTDKKPSIGSLPEPAESLDAGSSVQLIDMSEEGCGQRVPIESVWDAEGDKFIDPNTLKVSPIPGFPLRPATPYAFIVTTGFGGRGAPTGRPQTFADYLNGDGSDEALSESFEPLRECLPYTDLAAAQVAVATVFTTQDPVEETRRLRETVWSEDTELQGVRDWEEWTEKSTDDYIVFRGTLKAPIFQRGVAPYPNDGDLEFDEDGRAVIQRWESVPFSVTVPTSPDGPLNLLIWEDGTGANLASHVGDEHVVKAVANGFAVAAFVPQFHEGRPNASSDPVMDTFNYLNPQSGRTVFRQQVAETSHFIRLLEEKVIKLDELPEIDTERIYYGGHSQGALIGAMVAGVEPRIDTYALNGVGSYLTETIIFRKDPFDIAALVQNLFGVSRDIDRFHPIVQMAQLGADVVDPHNYARHWTGWGDGVGGASVFLINGKYDDTTSTVSMNALMASADVPVVGEPGWDVAPWDVRDVEMVDPPVEANRESTSGKPLTFGAYLTADQGHFTIYYEQDATDAMVGFWTSSAAGSAVIDY